MAIASTLPTAPTDGRALNACLWAIAAVIAALACFVLVEPVVSMPFRVARNFNEGWNAYWALTASTGGLLYPPMDALISNTYPPVSFLVLGFLGRTPADPILVGRVVALISLLVVTVNIGIWLRLNGTRFSVAVLSSVAFIVTMDMLGPGYIAKNDPQWFAHALITTAMVILWRDPRSSTRVVSAATLVLLGGWAKHLLIALPTALSVWLFQVNRRAFWRWLALLGALSALFAAIALSHYGHDLISGVLWTPRRVSVKRVFMVATTVLPPLIPLAMLRFGTDCALSQLRRVSLYYQLSYNRRRRCDLGVRGRWRVGERSVRRCDCGRVGNWHGP
jgi:hypothetical protein